MLPRRIPRHLRASSRSIRTRDHFHDNLKRASTATADQTGAVLDGFAVGILRYRGILRPAVVAKGKA